MSSFNGRFCILMKQTILMSGTKQHLTQITYLIDPQHLREQSICGSMQWIPVISVQPIAAVKLLICQSGLELQIHFAFPIHPTANRQDDEAYQLLDHAVLSFRCCKAFYLPSVARISIEQLPFLLEVLSESMSCLSYWGVVLVERLAVVEHKTSVHRKLSSVHVPVTRKNWI